MRILLLCCLNILLAGCALIDPPDQPRTVLVIHGGAGTITRAKLTQELEQQYRAKLTEALVAGYGILRDGGSSLDAVESTLVLLEDSPLFNAGVGAVFTNQGLVEMDASIMSGADRNAGAIAGVRTIPNPIKVARQVMEQSEHVLLTGTGAEQFAAEHGTKLVPNSQFHTERRLEQLRKAQAAEQTQSALSVPPVPPVPSVPSGPGRLTEKFGTVGAVALDQKGNLAAGTTTGGMTNKRYGRVGDSPIIGAGTWADNQTCGVSATGHGEYFIRLGVAQDVASRMKYLGLTASQAGDQVINGALTAMGGTGGVIILDRSGNVATPFNTEGMYRGWVDDQGRITVRIYGDE